MIFKYIFFLLFCFNLSFAQDIKVNSKNKELNKKLSKFLLKKNLTKDFEIEQSAIDWLTKKSYIYPQIKLKKEKKVLSIEIKNPIKYEILSAGSTEFSNYELKKIMDIENFFISSFLEEIKTRLVNKYKNIGYQNIKIEAKITVKSKFVKQIKFKINEGKKFIIKKIYINGLYSKPEYYYIKFLKKNGGESLNSHIYSQQELRAAEQNLIYHLNNQGLLSAEIYLSKIETNKNLITLHYLLKEGSQTLIKEVQIKGNTVFTDLELEQKIQVKMQNKLNFSKLEQDLQNLKITYKEKGFLNMKIKKPVIEYNSSKTWAKINFYILEGAQAVIEKIEVVGNQKIPSHLIQKISRLKVGEILTEARVDEAISTLSELNVFSKIQINLSEKLNKKVATISVAEKKPGFVRFQTGLSTYKNLTFRNSVSLDYNNLFNKLKRVSLQFLITSNFQKLENADYQLSLKYTEPLFFNTNFKQELETSIAREFFNLSETNEDLKYNDLSTKKINFNIFKKTHQNLSWKLNLFDFESRTETVQINECKKQKSCESNLQSIGGQKFYSFWDYRDSSFEPKKGSSFSLELQHASPQFFSSKNIQFWKANSILHTYIPLTKNLNFANSFSLGLISSPDKFGFPVSRAFIIGGNNSLRGFSGELDGERVPNKKEFPVQSINQIIYSPLSYYGLYKGELRFSIYKKVGGILFYDSGFVQIKNFSFKRKYRSSIGAGLNYKTPIGPLSLVLAFKIDPSPTENPYHIHISIGAF